LLWVENGSARAADSPGTGYVTRKKTGSEESVIDDLYLDVRVQLCRVVDVLVVVVLC
jgi:hypothetical protein